MVKLALHLECWTHKKTALHSENEQEKKNTCIKIMHIIIYTDYTISIHLIKLKLTL